jgi:4-hydroxy-tetrahydrodipicolinate reductase
MIRAALVGATGRMGQEIIRAAKYSSDIAITAAIASAQSRQLGCDAGEVAGTALLEVTIGSDLAAALDAADVVIDFSHPLATEATLAACRKAK